MKNTLEFKLLKYLSEKNNGILIDVSEIEENSNLLKSVIEDLKNRELIETESYPPKPKSGNGWHSNIPSEKPDKCKIKLLGVEYLNNIEKSIIESKLAKSNIRANRLNEKNARTNKIFGILNIVFAIINIIILILSNSESK